MSESDKKTSRALVARPGYEVGYSKPPAHSRFKPGQSGNPCGRPKGAKNKRPALNEERLKDIILDEAYREISVRDGNRNATVPMAQAVIRAMSVKAAKGDHRSQRFFAELLASTERANRTLHDQWLNTAMDYKIEWERELRRREALGITDLPEPLPHPDHVKIDFRAGTACIMGPMSPEEKAEWDDLARTKQVLEEKIGDLTEVLAAEEDEDERADIQRHIRLGQESLDLIKKVIPD
ncbi:DUF5681 domain-containing protein [Alisedimentitalea sp. MJ-SS2]|uniref:DUF5681 domain-containing protein n=1 Tax=Aliisedimentitalea sp. MJ-SS2 TaxID=3049795 RepID=UPI0029141C1B|nr:DUF5681 domain-containing protein [Alisedimentitalea sp. MJ-SS2]MDU8926268.1 DUF5681 domain-containing protein [Alisedimentitalea sp. MJ-SS2]